MTLRRLFVGIDGVVRTAAGLVRSAKPFVHWATQHFSVCWLSTAASPADVFALGRQLGLREDAVPYMGVRGGRAQHLARFPDALLVDVPLPPAEALLLAGRFFPVNPLVGVSQALQQRLSVEAVRVPGLFLARRVSV